MSGVIDSKGVQWEHCTGCGGWVRLSRLGYVKPSDAHRNGFDVCLPCAAFLLETERVRFEDVVPGNGWVPVMKEAVNGC